MILLMNVLIQWKIKERDYPKSPSKWNCNFCPYKEDRELCG